MFLCKLTLSHNIKSISIHSEKFSAFYIKINLIYIIYETFRTMDFTETSNIMFALRYKSNLTIEIYAKIGNSKTFQWENPSRKRKIQNTNSNEFQQFLLGQKIKGIRKKTALAICKEWNTLAEMMHEYFHEKDLNQNLTAYDWLYSKKIPNITKTGLIALCNRLGLSS